MFPHLLQASLLIYKLLCYQKAHPRQVQLTVKLPPPIPYNLTCAINGCLLRQVIFHGITLENNKKHTFKLVSHLDSNNESKWWVNLVIWLPFLHSTRRKIQAFEVMFWKTLQITGIIRKTIAGLHVSKIPIICYCAKWPVLFAPMKLEKQHSIASFTEANIWVSGYL